MYSLQYENSPILRNMSSHVTDFNDPTLPDLISFMEKTMFSLNGYGIAAPQVGANVRVVIVRLSSNNNDALVMINPLIVSEKGKQKFREGCLSLPNLFLDINRSQEIIVYWNDTSGATITKTFTGMDAVVIQHEIDHLNGKLFIDKASSMSVLLARKKSKQK